jgi:hypothetical protein
MLSVGQVYHNGRFVDDEPEYDGKLKISPKFFG